jgi:hypothetical protein
MFSSGAHFVKEDNVNEFITTIHTLVGKECWGITAGERTGSVIDLDFGKKIHRKHPGPNPALPADLRLDDGELGMFIECAWRLDAADRVICGWGESGAEGGPLGRGLQLIVNKIVERVSIEQPAFDLALHFENGLVLRVFCDQTESAEDSNNYVLFTPDHYYVVSNRSKLIRKED